MKNDDDPSTRTRKPFPKVEEITRRAFNVTVNSSKVVCNSQFPFCSVGSAKSLSPIKIEPQNKSGKSQNFQQSYKSQDSEKVETKRSDAAEKFQDSLQLKRHTEVLQELREIQKTISEISLLLKLNSSSKQNITSEQEQSVIKDVSNQNAEDIDVQDYLVMKHSNPSTIKRKQPVRYSCIFEDESSWNNATEKKTLKSPAVAFSYSKKPKLAKVLR